MSWDITVREKQWVDVEVADIGNYTCNVSNMYYDAMGVSLSYFNGMRAIDAVDLLSKGYTVMLNDPSKYKEMNPENGWGIMKEH